MMVEPCPTPFASCGHRGADRPAVRRRDGAAGL